MTFLPIVERELRVTARKAATYWLRFFAALIVGGIMLLALGTNRTVSPAQLAQELFSILGSLTLGFCIFSGVFQTADSLSGEKREGTAGLLFLTDLHGYDVVLGKLVANSIHGFYGLLSILPMLALPLLSGGVTAGEFWRVVLVLMGALFFSLSLGMAVSAISRETRQSMAGTLALALLIAGLLPALGALWDALFKTGLIKPLFWPSPGYTFAAAFDTRYGYGPGPGEFWGSLGIVVGIGLACLVAASWILPRAWQEKKQVSATGNRGWWWGLRFGRGVRGRWYRQRLLEANPFRWLASRDRLPGIGAWLLLGAAIPLWFAFVLAMAITTAPAVKMEMYQIAAFITLIGALVLKCMMAVEASRRLHDDRQSGALELLMVTPLPVGRIIAGQRQALRGQFMLPMLGMLVLDAGLIVVMQFGTPRVSDDGFSVILFGGNMLVLVADMYALSWVGMWVGLRARQHHRAVLGSVVRVLVPPWVAYFGSFVVMEAGLTTAGTVKVFFACWFLFGLVNDLFWAVRARRGLRKQFRVHATGTGKAAPVKREAMGVPRPVSV